jgi:type IV secretory pathway VirB10-like protein
MRRNTAFVVTALLALSVSACAKTEARIVVTPPARLDVPPPPPRMVEPVLADLPPEEEDATAQAAAADAPRPAPQPPPRPRAEASRPEAAAETQAPDLAKPSPSATLQTVPPSREGQMQRSIRVHLDTAIENLNRVDYALLGAEGRANFDQARRFIAQAEGALAAKNLVFAATVADKAATLAAQLAGR